MPEKKINLRFSLIAVFILFAALSRLIPHWYNFTPIGGMALFGAAYFTRKYWAFIIPFAALWISDLLLNNIVYAAYYEGFQFLGNLGVYIGFALIVVFGMVLLKKVKPGRLLVGSLGASAIFFLVSNFFVWLGSAFYPQNIAGLMACYEAGIPFFWNTVAGDLFYTSLLFGAFELLTRQYPILRPANA